MALGVPLALSSCALEGLDRVRPALHRSDCPLDLRHEQQAEWRAGPKLANSKYQFCGLTPHQGPSSNLGIRSGREAGVGVLEAPHRWGEA